MISDGLLISIVSAVLQGLHGGDFEEVGFTILFCSAYPYASTLFLTFKLHYSTFSFIQPVLVDVTCDVSDVNQMF